MLLRGTAIVSLLTLLSRLLGFVRDLLVARLLGASLFADAFFVAFRIPNLLRSIAAEGALTSAFVPVFSSALAESKERAIEVCKRAVSFALCLTIPLTLAGALFAEDIVRLIAPGFESDPERYALAISLTRMMMPYIICVSIIAILNSALNSLKVFGASAWARVDHEPCAHRWRALFPLLRSKNSDNTARNLRRDWRHRPSARADSSVPSSLALSVALPKALLP